MARKRGRGAAPDAQITNGEQMRAGAGKRGLTRREFVVTAAAAAVVAGCAPFSAKGNPSATSVATAGGFSLNEPAALSGDATIPAGLTQAVTARLGGHGGISVVYTLDSPVPPPDLMLTLARRPRATPPAPSSRRARGRWPAICASRLNRSPMRRRKSSSAAGSPTGQPSARPPACPSTSSGWLGCPPPQA